MFPPTCYMTPACNFDDLYRTKSNCTTIGPPRNNITGYTTRALSSCVVGKRWQDVMQRKLQVEVKESSSAAPAEVSRLQRVIQLLRLRGTDWKTMKKTVLNLKVKHMQEVCKEPKVKSQQGCFGEKNHQLLSDWAV